MYKEMPTIISTITGPNLTLQVSLKSFNFVLLMSADSPNEMDQYIKDVSVLCKLLCFLGTLFWVLHCNVYYNSNDRDNCY